MCECALRMRLENALMWECALRVCECVNVLMRFSLDLINFSGADSLHMIYSAELAGIPQSLQSRQNALVSFRKPTKAAP